MKNTLLFLTCVLWITVSVAQSDASSNRLVIPDKTPELEALYQEAQILELNGTAEEINANRLAIKNEWQLIDPAVAELYKPIVTEKFPNTPEYAHINGVYVPKEILPQEGGFAPEWATDMLLHDDWVDGLAMDTGVLNNNHIYIAIFENGINYGEPNDKVYIYRSTDGGQSFSQWQTANATAPIEKIKMVVYNAGYSEDSVILYMKFENKTLQAWRWNIDTGTLDAQVVATDVIDFDVDTNYPSNNAQRTFAAYQKSDNSLYTARSTAGSIGFDWVDEASLGFLGEQLAFTYGLNGSTYITFVGYNSRSLRANANSSYNDPATWGGTMETLTSGTSEEVINPTIRAERLEFATDKVVIWASKRAAGSSDNFNGIALKRVNGDPYVQFSDFSSGGSDWDIAHTDSWIRKDNNNPKIRFSYVRVNRSGAEYHANRLLTFNGTDFDPHEPVSDSDIPVFNGFPSVTAETSDNKPCMAFAGTSNGGTGSRGYGLYFDAQNRVVGIEENNFEDFVIYPNPTSNLLHFSGKNNIENIAVYSILGQKVMEMPINDTGAALNVSALTQGIYLLKATIEDQVATYKFIKN